MPVVVVGHTQGPHTHMYMCTAGKALPQQPYCCSPHQVHGPHYRPTQCHSQKQHSMQVGRYVGRYTAASQHSRCCRGQHPHRPQGGRTAAACGARVAAASLKCKSVQSVRKYVMVGYIAAATCPPCPHTSPGTHSRHPPALTAVNICPHCTERPGRDSQAPGNPSAHT